MAGVMVTGDTIITHGHQDGATTKSMIRWTHKDHKADLEGGFHLLMMKGRFHADVFWAAVWDFARTSMKNSRSSFAGLAHHELLHRH